MLVVSQIAFAQTRYELPCRTDVLSVSREIMKKQVGVRERGHNRGKEIKKYLASVGLNEGHPYCAAGQYYCFSEAAKLLGLPKSEIPIPRTAVANKVFDYAEKNGTRTFYQAFIDDLIIWRQGQTPYGHEERIDSVGRDGWVWTVGFNTGLNAREGDGVARKKRNIYHFLARMQVRGTVGFKRK